MDEKFHEVNLDEIGVSQDEMDKYMSALRFGGEARLICICGHQMTRHFESPRGYNCTHGKSWCGCRKPMAVLVPEDVSVFRFKTTGYGREHALTKGLHALSQKKKKVNWLIGRKCFGCGITSEVLHPVPLNEFMRLIYDSGKFNALFCKDCLIKAS